jgi:hypothetical protein
MVPDLGLGLVSLVIYTIGLLVAVVLYGLQAS